MAALVLPKERERQGGKTGERGELRRGGKGDRKQKEDRKGEKEWEREKEKGEENHAPSRTVLVTCIVHTRNMHYPQIYTHPT
jgi:hypothetical protein